MRKFLVMILLGGMSMGIASAQMHLSLNQAIEIALSDNPTIKVADLEIERYDYVYKQTVSSLYPQVSVSGQYSLAIRNQQMAEGLSFGGKNTFNVAGNVSLPLFDLMHPLWELYFSLRLLCSSKRAHLRNKI